MSELLESLEQKVPQLSEQRKVYEELRAENQQLQAQLEEVSTGRRALEATARTREKEAAALRHRAEDMARQVRALTVQVARLKGQRAHLPPREDVAAGAADPTRDMDANAVISERLVEFADVEELHSRNVQLLALVRELSADNERTRADVERSLRDEMEARERRLEAEVEEMRADRERERLLVAQVARQRDLFKALLQGTALGDAVESATVQAVAAIGDGGGGRAGTPGAGALQPVGAPSPRGGVDVRALVAEKDREMEDLRQELTRNADLLRQQLEVSVSRVTPGTSAAP